MSIEFPRPELPLKIERVLFGDVRTVVAEWCSPKSLRVESGLAWLAERAYTGAKDQNFWWIGPDYGATMGSLGLFKNAMTSGSYTQLTRSTAVLTIAGTTIRFISAENTSALYSDSVFAAVIDQAAKIPESAWYALRETLANTRAPVRIISTVEGRANWFNALARQAEAEPSEHQAWLRYNALDAIADGLMTSDDLDYARATLPDHIFRAMYLAEPYDDRIEAAHRATDPKLMTDEELAIIANIDPARLNEIADETLAALAQLAPTT